MTELFISCPLNTDDLLIDELKTLGLDTITQRRATGIYVETNLEGAYTILLHSRIATRVFWPIALLQAQDRDALYQSALEVDWSAHMSERDSFAIDFHGTNDALRQTQFNAQVVKDALCDYWMARQQTRPDVDKDRPDFRWAVFLRGDQAALSLDLSGDSLHQRGYRQAPVKAPLKENLAAALLYRAGWRYPVPFAALIDPMCGSGTLLTEAALIAANRAANADRIHWGFDAWKRHQPDLWQTIKTRADAQICLTELPAILGFDQDSQAVKSARGNARSAGFGDEIQIAQGQVEELTNPFPQTLQGLLLTNPPYGERLGDEQSLKPVYQGLGRQLKRYFSGWQVGIFTSNLALASELGLKAYRRHSFKNGPIEAQLLRYRVEPTAFKQSHKPIRTVADLLERYPHWLDATPAKALLNRLKKNQKQLSSWVKREAIFCYRLYDADIPEYGLALDLYQTKQGLMAHIQEYQAPMQIPEDTARERFYTGLLAIRQALPEIADEHLFIKQRRRQKGTAQYEKHDQTGQFFATRDGDVACWVNLTDYLDTGLFLDHRITRERVGKMAKGQDFLNLFCYTATASLHAVAQGAKSTTSVDLSHTYLEWAKANFQLNGFALNAHRFEQADCFQWLEDQQKTGQTYGVIFIDPPTFSNSKRMKETLDIQRDHARLLQLAARLLTPSGQIVFSNNYRGFKLDETLHQQFTIENISEQTLPPDFARNKKIHNAWLIRKN